MKKINAFSDKEPKKLKKGETVASEDGEVFTMHWKQRKMVLLITCTMQKQSLLTTKL